MGSVSSTEFFSLFPLPSYLLPAPCSLFPKIQQFVPNSNCKPLYHSCSLLIF
ncbi:MAG: hypothetical protein F6K49_41295 [Moorea sp. SIO3I6]|nr:hypothetical protein [Moorena sp. SIO3I6]